MNGLATKVIAVGGLLVFAAAVLSVDPKADAKKQQEVFFDGFQRELETCAFAGLLQPVWRYTGNNRFSFHCTDDNGVLVPVLAPKEHSLSRSRPKHMVLVDDDTVLPGMSAEAEAEFAHCKQWNLVHAVWRLEGFTNEFFCTGTRGVLYRATTPRDARYVPGARHEQ